MIPRKQSKAIKRFGNIITKGNLRINWQWQKVTFHKLWKKETFTPIYYILMSSRTKFWIFGRSNGRKFPLKWTVIETFVQGNYLYLSLIFLSVSVSIFIFQSIRQRWANAIYIVNEFYVSDYYYHAPSISPDYFF